MSGFKNLRQAVENRKTELSGFEGKFLKTYEKALIKDDVENQQVIPSNYFRPSSLYGCERMLYYMRKGADRSSGKEPALIGICHSGTDRHTRIQDTVSKMEDIKMLDIAELVSEANQNGLDTEFMGWNLDGTEGRCKSKEFSLYFQPDGAFRFDGKDVLLEIKTESTYSFNKRFEPKPDHVMQATAYAMGLNLSHVLFFYEDRNVTNHKLYLVEITDEMKFELLEKIYKINGYIEHDVLPEKDTEKCTYCGYKNLCSYEYNFEYSDTTTDEIVADVDGNTMPQQESVQVEQGQ